MKISRGHALGKTLTVLPLLILAGLLLYQLALSHQQKTDRVIFQTTEGEMPVEVELAFTPSERATGLMHRESLPEDHGMLFIFPPGHRGSFHMKNTLIPLDMIFADENGRIFLVEKMTTPLTGSGYGPSDGIFTYCVEVNGGFADKHNVRVGDTMVLRLVTPVIPK